MIRMLTGFKNKLKVSSLCGIVFFSAGILFPVFSQTVPVLFEIEDSDLSGIRAKSPAELESALVTFDENTLDLIRKREIEHVQIIDHNENRYDVEIRRVIHHDEINWSVTGHIGGNWKNRFTLSYSGNQILSGMNIVSEHNFYQIKYEETSGGHIMLKVDPHQLDELNCGADHDEMYGGMIMEKVRYKLPEIEYEGPATVDVMIIYTPQAEQWANLNDGGIDNVINESMAIAQISADNSGLNLEFRLVHRERVEYNEDGNSVVDLRRLTASSEYNPWGSDYSDYLQEIHNMRYQYGADLVAMFTYTNDVGGLAWLLNSTNGRPELGFSVTRVQQASWTSTHAHEMGHNFGNDHSRNQQINAAGVSGGLFEYSTGWRWTGQDGVGYTSVMTYREGNQAVDIFSNPEILYQGTPTGSYSGQYAPSDNARSMREIKHVIAGYKERMIDVNAPEVVTADVQEIAFTTAKTGGIVTDDGGRFVESRGVCYNEFSMPGFSDTCISGGSGTGEFTMEMTELAENTRYFVRAYATNSIGTTFGDEKSFITLSRSAPVVSTLPVLQTGVSSAIAAGEITDDGGGEVTGTGVCWSEQPGPGLNDTCKSANVEAGIFEVEVTGLNHSTSYFIRAYAMNETGTAFGDDQEFTTETLHPPELLAVTEVNAVSFKANWQEVPEADGYRLDVSRNEDFSTYLSGYENRNVADGTSATITGLSPGQEYYYRLRSEIETGKSDNSDDGYVQTLNVSAGGSSVKNDPERVLATGIQESEVVVVVRDRDGEVMEGIGVRIEPDGGSSEIIAIQEVSNEAGEALFSVTNEVEETIHYTVFAAELQLQEQFRIEFLFSEGELLLGNNFPNPFQNQTHIPVVLPERTRIRIDIYNSTGARVQTIRDEELNTGYYEIPFDAAALSSGVYFYRLITNREILTEKMLLVR
ncbi:MAG: fibronectin type III domain-containing protein [Balneolaceae bacterium]|nr:fibronectin type III domain-containing protein [Balneolaceae bacterium]